MQEEINTEKSLRKSKFNPMIIWDFVMVLIVLANLTLIVFDLTYLWLRPFYFQNFPKVVKMYDKPILGIEGHRSTDKYLRFVEELEYLEKIKNQEFYDKEFEIATQELKMVVESINSNNDDKLEKVKNELLENLILIASPSQVGQKFMELEEDLLDLMLHKEKDPIYTRLEKIEQKFDLLVRVRDRKGWESEKASVLSKMDYQIIHIVETNPFKESGQTENLENIKTFIKSRYDEIKTRGVDREYRAILTESLGGQKSYPSTALAFTYFWRNPGLSMEEKINIFNENLKNEFAVNYFRHVGKDGKPIDNYLMLDAPFLIFFFFEFSISWFLAIRRKTYLAWFLYPIYHWYDILGLIPVVEFRFFRLIRVYKIYLILKTSRIMPVGDDIISRTIRYYSNIIKEELSDMVTIQIISESQEEIRSGASMQILTNALDAHRPDIKKVVLKKMRETATNQRLGELIETLIAEILDKTQSSLRPIGLLPDSFKNKLSREISSIIYNTFSKAVLVTLDDESGRKTVESLVDFVIDEFEHTAEDKDVNDLNTSITVELLENVKKSVARKKWLDTKI
ncbi:MAG: hypothetical protein JJT78_00285 [Leptospira sp.]|nr:hypothetical protein [Leptospira sp.]